MFNSNLLNLLLISGLFLSPVFESQINFEHNSNRSSTRDFKFQHLPSPRKDDAASKATLTMIEGVLDGGSGELTALTDGVLPTNADDPGANFYFNAGSMGGRFRMDFGKSIDIAQVLTYSWHPGSRGPQLYKLYAAEGTEANFNIGPKRGVDPSTCGWHFIATVSTIPKQGEDGGQYVASVTDSGGSLGKYRYLMFDCYVTELNDDWGNTFYSEIDVVEKP